MYKTSEIEIEMHDLKKYNKAGVVYKNINGVKTPVQKYILKEKFKDSGLKKSFCEYYSAIPQYVKDKAILLVTYGKMSNRMAAEVCGISEATVRNELKKSGDKIKHEDLVADKSKLIENVIIDELYHNTGKGKHYIKGTKKVKDNPNKKAKKPRKFKEVWVLAAINGVTGELLSLEVGKRNTKTLKKLVKKLDEYQYKNVYTDNWKPYTTIFSKKKNIKHEATKTKTYRIESYNNEIRQHCGRFVRKANGVSQSSSNVENSMKLFNYHRNEKRNNEYNEIKNIDKTILIKINKILKETNSEKLFIFK